MGKKDGKEHFLHFWRVNSLGENSLLFLLTIAEIVHVSKAYYTSTNVQFDIAKKYRLERTNQYRQRAVLAQPCTHLTVPDRYTNRHIHNTRDMVYYGSLITASYGEVSVCEHNITAQVLC